jgi:hypothetical protein
MDFDLQYEEAIHSGNESLWIQLALHQAKSRGFNVPAYHGTFQDFEEFKEHDIGFHFAKCKFVAMNRLDDKFDDYDMDVPGKILHVALSIHNPIVVKADLGSWNAKDILDAASFKYAKIPFMP